MASAKEGRELVFSWFDSASAQGSREQVLFVYASAIYGREHVFEGTPVVCGQGCGLEITPTKRSREHGVDRGFGVTS